MNMSLCQSTSTLRRIGDLEVTSAQNIYLFIHVLNLFISIISISDSTVSSDRKLSETTKSLRIDGL